MKYKTSKKDLVMRKKRSGMVSTERLHKEGKLGTTLPQKDIPENMTMADYTKSVLHVWNASLQKTNGAAILQKQVDLALKGSTKSAEFLFDRAFGKPTQSIQVQQVPEVVIEHNTITIDAAKA